MEFYIEEILPWKTLYMYIQDSEPLDNADKSKTMPAEKTEGLSLADEIVNNSNLPWQDNLDPSPTHLADSIPNNEPVIAHVPSWVNNLSYSHITETGSPYVSPQTTIIPQKTDYHKTVYSLFSEAFNQNEVENNNTDNNTDANVQTVTSSEYFPPPWGKSVSDDCPQLSPMTMESAIRSEELLQSSHNEQAPDHHHVIVPTTHHLFDSASNSSTKHGNGGHLTEVASAPDFQHWRPISKGSFIDNSMRLQSDTMLTEMAFQEGVKTRVQEWLKLANSEEENDADEEDEDGNSSDISSSAHASSDDENDGLDTVDEIERELDIAMSLDKKHL